MNKREALIKTTRKTFFKHWLALTKPLHKLRPQEQEVLALLLYYYYEYKKDISREDLVWKMVFDYDTKMLMKEDLNGMKDVIFQNTLSSLRKKGVVKNKQVNTSFIPNISEDAKEFSLIFKFELNDGI